MKKLLLKELNNMNYKEIVEARTKKKSKSGFTINQSINFLTKEIMKEFSIGKQEARQKIADIFASYDTAEYLIKEIDWDIKNR